MSFLAFNILIKITVHFDHNAAFPELIIHFDLELISKFWFGASKPPWCSFPQKNGRIDYDNNDEMDERTIYFSYTAKNILYFG